ncbi:hypothetical protein GTQ38_03935 [Flavobacteriaceae bacterium R33]|uniref:Uncharacterized protein n=1 Tax=Poritiphilus flavus TaxID=2697053 RepID=A0A6L9E8U0_9FLAO|nr:hypothetical protein [Poritiphilus flavus]
MTALVLTVLIFGCESDDSDNNPVAEAWELEVEQLKSETLQFMDFSVAENEGRIDVSGYVPNMGHHYLNPALVDGTFELDKPEIILYVPDQNGGMQMVAVEYAIIPENPDNPGNPPEGFTGDQDVWHFNEMVGQWQLHVWTILENPDGIFAPFNPAIGD